MIDYSTILDSDWFYALEISKPFGELDDGLYLPIDYEEYESSFYFSTFPGNEEYTLFRDMEKDEYIMRVGIREPIGDYGSHWVFMWYRSIPEYLGDIKSALESAGYTRD